MTSVWRSIVFPAIAFLSVAMAQAQSPASAPTPPETATQNETVPPAPAANSVTLKQGTEVHLKLGQRLSAKTSAINAPVELVLDEDLKAGEVVVANKGARVIGRVTEGKKDCVNGPCGWRDKRQPGKQLGIRLEYAITPYGKIELSGEEHAKTHRNTGAIVASTAAFGLAGLIVSWDATAKTVLEENTPLVAKVASDFDLPLPSGSH
jgi:hypothetical protein